MIRDKIDQDLKQAMLDRDAQAVSTLRGLKSALQYAAVAKGANSELDENETIATLQKEAKKRQEAADLYKQAGNTELESKEISEKAIIEQYLPKQLTEEELISVIEETISEAGEVSRQNMGQIIGKVKQKTGGAADGAMVARLVKDRVQG